MTKSTLALLILLLTQSFGLSQNNKTEVIICSSIHGLHKANIKYSYDSLFTFIDKYNPDVIGVEIRNEDIDSTVSYLKRNYPFEMYECISKYNNKKVVGIDWLGADIVGGPIPVNYWKEISAVKKIQQQLDADSTVNQKLSILDYITNEKINIAKKGSIKEVNDGRYDLINTIFYKQLTGLLNGTPYSGLTDFYNQRDSMIASNIIKIIGDNPGKKLLFLVGADHRSYSLNKVNEELGSSVVLIDP